MPARICPSCGDKNFGPICTNCGQRLPDEKKGPVRPPRPSGANGGSAMSGVPPLPPPNSGSGPIAPVSPGDATDKPGFQFSPGGHSRTEIISPPSPLPPSLLRTAPLIEGKVIDVTMIEMEDTGHNTARTCLGIIMMPFSFFNGLITILSGSISPKVMKRVTVARIRTPTLDEFEVRVEKELQAATFGIGDYISVWGQEKDGVYYLHHGYNHRTKGIIKLK